ncbi:uncharacterized protein [Nicotiana tomentosiformis]|uniref:uncharacterized protein n=1 Tax=Nicotiana tomentosiformis TaxID=4098 RepID=UPI00051BD5D3|nr:uncharacterized protein LOC104119189 [Nicotiana tomentosiformis]XP_009628920.1 uncharacterized protein LOC104119189 [Nicotiana tomentosiformis]
MANPPWDSLQLVSEPTILSCSSDRQKTMDSGRAQNQLEQQIQAFMARSNRKIQHLAERYHHLSRTFHSSSNQYEAQRLESEQWISDGPYANHQYAGANTHCYRESSGVEQYHKNLYAYTYPHPYYRPDLSCNPYGVEYCHGDSRTCPYQVPYAYHFDGNYLGSYFVQLGNGSVVLVTAAPTTPTYRDEQTVLTKFRKNRKKRRYLNVCSGRIEKHKKHPGSKRNAGKMHHLGILFDEYHLSYFGKVGKTYFHKRINLFGTSTLCNDVEVHEDEEETSVNCDACALLEIEVKEEGSSVEDQVLDESSHTNETLEISPNEITTCNASPVIPFFTKYVLAFTIEDQNALKLEDEGEEKPSPIENEGAEAYENKVCIVFDECPQRDETELQAEFWSTRTKKNSNYSESLTWYEVHNLLRACNGNLDTTTLIENLTRYSANSTQIPLSMVLFGPIFYYRHEGSYHQSIFLFVSATIQFDNCRDHLIVEMLGLLNHHKFARVVFLLFAVWRTVNWGFYLDLNTALISVVTMQLKWTDVCLTGGVYLCAMALFPHSIH